MNKSFYLLLALACYGLGSMQAEQISEAQAIALARQFVGNSAKTQSLGAATTGAQPKIAYTAVSKKTNSNLLYVVDNGNNAGYVVIAGDDMVDSPVLGYADNGTFNYEELPENLQWWLSEYGRQIEYAIENGISTSASSAPTFDTKVEPLIKTKWDQTEPYNNMCPVLPNYGGERAATGCAATALAQLMYYYRYPEHGTGENSYTWNGTRLSADFENTYYKWDLMQWTYDNTSSQESIDAVAELMYHCGIAQNMEYGWSSGALTFMPAIALQEYFGYSRSIQYINRDYRQYDEWVSIIKGEIDAAHPVFYTGQSSGGGHAFIIDGYNSEGYFHVNWGWRGLSDGYFRLAALNPGEQGTGAGSNSGYNYTQGAVINVKVPEADDALTFEITCDNLEDNTKTATKGSNSSIAMGICYNQGCNDADMYIGAIIKDMNDEVVSQTFSSRRTRMPMWYGNQPVIQFEIPANIADGTYKIYPAYRKYEDDGIEYIHIWHTSSQYVEMTVDGDNVTMQNAPVKTQENIHVDNISLLSIIADGVEAKVEATISNNGSSTFSEELGLGLVDMNTGEIVYDGYNYAVYSVVTIPAGESVTVTLSQEIEFEGSGQYYLALMTSDGIALNDMIPVKVGNPKISLNGAPTFIPSNENVNASNMHLQATIVNPDNVDYLGSINAYLYPAGGGSKIKLFASKQVSIDPQSTVVVDFYGTFTEGVDGESYMLMLEDGSRMLLPPCSFTLSNNSGAVSSVNVDKVGVYPNPADDIINVTAAETIDNVTLFNIAGATIGSYNGDGSSSMQINVDNLPAGNYFVRITTGSSSSTLKFIKK